MESFDNPDEGEWIYDADEWDEWFTRNDGDTVFNEFLPVLPSLPEVHSRVRRAVPATHSRSGLNDFDPKEVIHAYRENLTPLMLFTVIIFGLVALALPLIFTAEHLFVRPDRQRRIRKVFPEDDEEQESEPEDVDFIRSATHSTSTQLALDDEDDIMKDLTPSDLQFTMIAHPNRFRVPQTEESFEDDFDSAGFVIQSKPTPSHQPVFQPPRRSDPLNPTVVRVPTTLRFSSDSSDRPTKDAQRNLSNVSRLDEPDITPQEQMPHPSKVRRQNEPDTKSKQSVQRNPNVVGRKTQPDNDDIPQQDGQPIPSTVERQNEPDVPPQQNVQPHPSTVRRQSQPDTKPKPTAQRNPNPVGRKNQPDSDVIPQQDGQPFPSTVERQNQPDVPPQQNVQPHPSTVRRQSQPDTKPKPTAQRNPNPVGRKNQPDSDAVPQQDGQPIPSTLGRQNQPDMPPQQNVQPHPSTVRRQSQPDTKHKPTAQRNPNPVGRKNRPDSDVIPQQDGQPNPSTVGRQNKPDVPSEQRGQPYPLAVARQNQSGPVYIDDDEVIQKRPMNNKKKVGAVKVASVPSQTSNGRIPNIAPRPQTVPNKSTTQQEVPATGTKNPREGAEALEKQPGTGTSRTIDETTTAKKNKYEGKVLVGNSRRFQSGVSIHKPNTTKPNQDFRPCTCPHPSTREALQKSLVDLTWYQLLDYAQADGGWYEEEQEEGPQENPEDEEDQPTTSTKKDTKKGKKGK